MYLRTITFLVFLSFATLVVAEETKMQFTLTPYSCGGNASHCLPYVDAEGIITKNTPNDFEEFLKKNIDEEFNRIIFLESNGGNLLASIELAFLIRKHEFDTEVLGKCYSACTYAFLGGKSRKMNEDAMLGVHRFYASDNIGDDKTQHMTAVLSILLDKMEVNRQMLDIASLTDSNKMTKITRGKAIKLNIVNTVPTLSDWELKARNDGTIYTCSQSKENNRGAKGRLCFSISRNPKTVTAEFSFTINQEFRSSKELRETYDAHNDNEISINLHLNSNNFLEQFNLIPDDLHADKLPLEFEGNSIFSKKHSPWELTNKNTFTTKFTITENFIMKLLKEREFEFSGNFSRYAVDVEPKIKFSTKNLGINLLAINKQAN